eukprot:5670046-Heterocapsa_arctica.AAC.1
MFKDKSDSENQSVVESSRNMFQKFFDRKDERNREVAKAEQEHNNTIVQQVTSQAEQKTIERKDIQQKDFQQHKKPRIEEPEDNKDTNTGLLNLLNKRKVEQD